MFSSIAKTIAPIALFGALLPAVAVAEDASSNRNLISFDVSESIEVNNDEATARMSKTIQARTAKELASQINPIINKALAAAKKYPDVTITTGAQHAYPRYDNKGKMIGVEGRASINLTSNNTESLSLVIKELQNTLVLDAMNFNISKNLLELTNNHLMGETTQKFKTQADTITKLWGAKGYKLVNVKLNTNDGYSERAYATAVTMIEKDSTEAQIIEAGTSTVSYTIDGTIALVF